VTEEHNTPAENQPSKLVLYGLAMVGGLGVTMMIVAAIIGVIGGAELDATSTRLIGLSIVGGLLLLITAIGFWLGLVRPFANFDDINVPLEPEPHH
jgi:hypothetical protein